MEANSSPGHVARWRSWLTILRPLRGWSDSTGVLSSGVRLGSRNVEEILPSRRSVALRQHREVAAGAVAFQKALTESRFMDPLLALTCFVGGAALLIPRMTPLGIVVLAPVVAVIFLFHVVLSGNWMWGSLNLIWLGALAWRYRNAFSTLWNDAQ